MAQCSPPEAEVEAVTVASPTATAVTTPFSSTVAMSVSLDDHETLAPSISSPSLSRTRAV